MIYVGLTSLMDYMGEMDKEAFGSTLHKEVSMSEQVDRFQVRLAATQSVHVARGHVAWGHVCAAARGPQAWQQSFQISQSRGGCTCFSWWTISGYKSDVRPLCA